MKRVSKSKESPKSCIVDDMNRFGRFERRLMELQVEVERLLSSCAEDDVPREEVKGGVVEGKGDGNGGCPDSDSDSEVRDHEMNVSILGNGGCHDLELLDNEVNGSEGDRYGGCLDLEMLGNEVKSGGNDAMQVEEVFGGGKMSRKLVVDVSDGAMNGGEKCGDNHNKGLVLDSSGEDSSDGGKRKRDVLDSSGGESDGDGYDCKRMKGPALDMLSWLKGAAKNSCDPEVGSIPEKSKWKSYSNQEMWKQVLLFREATFLQRGTDPSSEQRSWQSQKMHPYLYEDHLGTNYNLRERSKRDKKDAKSASSGRSSSDSQGGTESRTPSPHPEDRSEKRLLDSFDTNSGLDRYATVRIPLGENHQAILSEWTGRTSEDYSKYSGTQVWPSKTKNTSLLIERDPIGKGRQDSCGCPVPGSAECVRFHITEKRAKLHMELGAAFYDWNFDQAGEDARLLWTEEEEKNFEDAIQSKPTSSETCFWDHILKAFPTKSRAELVSYYFNVFILKRRGYQNRHTPDNINSDDDDDEPGPLRNVFGHQTQNSRSSFLLTPKKSQTKKK